MNIYKFEKLTRIQVKAQAAYQALETLANDMDIDPLSEEDEVEVRNMIRRVNELRLVVRDEAHTQHRRGSLFSA